MKNITDIIKKISDIHPSSLFNFDELYSNLLNEEKKGYINKTSHPDFPHLFIFKYSNKCNYDEAWNVFTLMARGLVLDIKDKKVITRTMPKFFNHNEIDINKVFQKQFVATEKLDGSCGVLFNFYNNWIVSTLGSFTSDQSIWAKKYLDKNIKIDKLNTDDTYVFEIIYKENKIVVPYDYEGLSLITIFDKNGREYGFIDREEIAKDVGFLLPKIYEFNNIDDIKNEIKSLDRYRKGFVIRFSNGVRVKMKGDEYLRIHRLMSQVTPLAIWDIMKNEGNLEDIRKELPEELIDDFNNIYNILNERLNELLKEIEIVTEETKEKNDRDLGNLIQNHPQYFAFLKYKESKRFIFSKRKGKFDNDFSTINSYLRNKVFEIIRPANNKL